MVTGGAGFIGSHTCLSLLKMGYEVTVLDSFLNSNPLSIKRVKMIANSREYKNNLKISLVEGDITDLEAVSNLFERSFNSGNPISAVIHFAGLKSVSESLSNPKKYWDINVRGSLNLFNVMESYNCKKIIFSSSATVYGNPTKDNLDESHIINPVHPYAQTKAKVEKILIELSKTKKWRILNLRYFNPIGAHASGLIGECPLSKTNNLFPLILKVASREKEKLKIYGNDWNTPDGTCIRDFIHVMDLADAHLESLNYILHNENEIKNINIGTGIGTSVLDLIERFSNVTKRDVPYLMAPRRNGDVPRLVAKNNLALEFLNWEPKRTINQMCKDGWNWIQENPNGFN